jgi:phytol kinase
MSPWLGILLVLVTLVVLLGLVSLLKRRCVIHPELSRKLVHIIMGLVTLSFPWVFQEAWPVIVLAILSVSLLLGIQSIPHVKSRLGAVLGDVERTSLGDVYFPIAVASVFTLAQGNLVLYLIPILILTLADAVSALIGVQYGVAKFVTSDGHKSVEGSLAFFTVAFLSTHLPLLLLTDTGRPESVLIGLMMGVMLMLFEAVSTRGLDNLFIPLGAFVLLTTYLPLGPDALVIKLIVLIPLLLFTLMFRRRMDLIASAVLLSALVLYTAWALGGWLWLMPPLLLMATHRLLMPDKPSGGTNQDRIFGTRVVITIAGSGLFWLFLHTQQSALNLYPSYLAAYTSQLALIGLSSQLSVTHTPRRLSAWWSSSLFAMLMLGLPCAVLYCGLSPQMIWVSAVSLLSAMLSGGTFIAFQPNMALLPQSMARWVGRAVIVLAWSSLGLVFL